MWLERLPAELQETPRAREKDATAEEGGMGKAAYPSRRTLSRRVRAPLEGTWTASLRPSGLATWFKRPPSDAAARRLSKLFLSPLNLVRERGGLPLLL